MNDLPGAASEERDDPEGQDRFPTIESIVAEARRVMPPESWDYASGGGGAESTLRRNRAALDAVGFRPRLMTDVRSRSADSRLLGCDLSMPVMFAPVGAIHRYHPAGALAVARAAADIGTLTFISSVARPSPEEIRESADPLMVFQLYARGGRDWLAAQVCMAERAGCRGLCLTADAAVTGWRERNLLNDFTRVEDAAHRYQEAFTWSDLAWLRGITELPLILKGITTAQQAVRAVEVGCNMVYVSNHGGRQLDDLPATIEVLPEVVDAVSDSVGVLVDGGFVRGTDVVKAIAMGADGVLVGKLMVWALAAGGVAGLRRAFDLLRAEILTVMALLGVTSLQQLDRTYLRPISDAPGKTWTGLLPPASEGLS